MRSSDGQNESSGVETLAVDTATAPFDEGNGSESVVVGPLFCDAQWCEWHSGW